jgi:hypothetical protein
VPLSTAGNLKLGIYLSQARGTSGLPTSAAHRLDIISALLLFFPETACNLGANIMEIQQNKRSPLEGKMHMSGQLQAKCQARAGQRCQMRSNAVIISAAPEDKKGPMAYADVFDDDFSGVGQNHPMNLLENQRKVLMHKIDKIF